MIKTLNNIFSKRNYLLFSLFYTTIKFFLDIRTERVTQYIFFAISFLYLLNIIRDDYKRLIKKEFIVPYLIIVFAVISILVSKVIDLVSIRAIIMLLINFFAITIDDPYDRDYIRTFELIVLLVLIISNIHSLLCLVLCTTDILNITNLGVYAENRLAGFTFFNGTGEVALLGIGSIVFFLEKASYNSNNKFFVCNIIFICLHIIVVVLTQNRLALYGLILCLIIYCILKIAKENKTSNVKRFIKYLGTVILFIVIIYIVLLILDVFKLRKFSLLSKERVDIWFAYLSVFSRENIFLGMGPGRAAQVFMQRLGDNSLENYIDYFNDYDFAYKMKSIRNWFAPFMPHNEYIRHMIMFGIVGIALIIVYVTSMIYKLIKMYRMNDKYGLLVCYLSVFYFVFPLISGCVENTFSFTNSPRYFINYVFFFIVGYINKMYYESSIVANH